MMSDGLRRRRHLAVARALGSSISDKSTIPTSNVVVEEPSRETQIRLHTLTADEQLMTVRFDLAQSAEEEKAAGEKGSPYLDLCVIRYGSSGLMEVSPDFSHGKRPYRIDSPSGDAYEYWLEHASPSMQYDTQLKEALMLNDVYAKLTQQRMSLIGEDFEQPPNRTFRLVLHAEIVSAHDFYHDGLFVHYFVELPLGWSAAADSQLCGMTHACTANSAGAAHFSHALSADLLFDVNRFDLRQEALPKWPQLFFEVVSVDSWTRCRSEGYGFTSVPYCAGAYDVAIETWRPVAPRAEMKRFFVGGTPELDDLTYAGTPGDVDGKILSRFGFRTVSGGSVRLRMNVAHQSRAFGAASGVGVGAGRRLPVRTLMDRLGSATLFSSVSSVLEAFEKARARMQRATRGYEDVNLDRREPDDK